LNAFQSASGRTLVKICGLKTPDAALCAARCGADFIGFVFAESRRRVTAEEAAAIAKGGEVGRFGAKIAGVFVNPDPEQLERVMETVRLDAIQLSGSEPPAFVREVKARFPDTAVIKAIDASGEPEGRTQGGSAAERLLAYAGAADAILLDTAGGGTGRQFDWAVLPGCKAAAAKIGVPLFVAGGLDPDNVAGLVRRYRPDGVDVSSGVETGGAKDAAKIAAFIERVRTIETQRA
jgi:phosphoribosylanthranilate isomerase